MDAAVTHVQAINDGVAEWAATLDNSAAHATYVGRWRERYQLYSLTRRYPVLSSEILFSIRALPKLVQNNRRIPAEIA